MDMLLTESPGPIHFQAPRWDAFQRLHIIWKTQSPRKTMTRAIEATIREVLDSNSPRLDLVAEI